MVRSPLRSFLAVAAAAAALLSAGRAGAFERSWRAGGSLGYAALFGGPNASGLGGGLHVTYGVSDSWNLMAATDVTLHPYPRWLFWSGTVGVTYVVDVLEWVPYAGALAGGAGIFSVNPNCGASIVEPCKAFRIDLELPFGLDYHVTPRLAVGVAGRFRILLLGEVPWMTMGAFARAEYVWGG